MTIRTLVLSGGGGRGAFHAGVYNYLCKQDKGEGITEAYRGAWVPDIVVGTSIGAVNGAAITQGIAPEALEAFWLSLRERDIQGLPPGMGWLARRVVNLGLARSIGVPLQQVARDEALSPDASESWPPIPVLPRWVNERLIGRWSNLLDTAPLYRTLRDRLKLDEQQIQDSDKTLLISATNVRTGQGVIFSNRQILHPKTHEPQDFVHSPVTLRRIIASCSIPMVYPWTKDEDEYYWDGAVLANTPLGPAFDAVRDRPLDEPMEVIVVMMTPWWERAEDAPASYGKLPQDFGEAMTWTLDWALLASFRAELKLMRSYNRLVTMAEESNQEPAYRYVRAVIVAPNDFLPVARIIDYDEQASRDLIAKGEMAAAEAFHQQFGSAAHG